MNRERIVLWGSGKRAKAILKNYCYLEDMFQLVGIVDNNEKMWDRLFENYAVLNPKQIHELKFDKVIISTDEYYDEIENQLVNDLCISIEKIENYFYFAKKKLLCKYRDSQDKEVQEIIKYLSFNPMKVFNHSYVEAYKDMEVEISFDEEAGLYYVIHQGRRLYMAKHLDTERKVAKYYRGICMEQDKLSPHKYLDETFQIKENSVVVDVGVAEGNFSLEIIEKASKVYIIEADKDWIEALQYTFADFKDKVVIINAFVSDYTAYGTFKLDDLVHEPVDFIKMDIEGSEIEAFKGAVELINKSNNLKCAICTYHNDNDDIVLKKLAEEYGMSYSFTPRYMFYPVGIKQLFISPVLRKGIIRCWKDR